MPDICVEKYLPDMVAMRRKLHTYPEEGWTEFVTTTRIIEALRATGLEPKFGKDVIDVNAVMGRREAIVEKAWEVLIKSSFLAFFNRSAKNGIEVG